MSQNQTPSWLRYANQSATRNLPLSDRLINTMSFLGDMGIEMEVFSGGQPEKGSGLPRVGEVRHDHGEAADVFFYKDGRRLDWASEEDLPVFQEIVRKGRSRGLTGVGAGEGYMQPGSMHIGFGTEAVWGKNGKGANAPDWLSAAYNSPVERSQLPNIPVSNTSNDLRSSIIELSKQHGWDPVDIATVMSFETGGTFDPWQKGPTTQWGTHRGLIQWGEPQAKKYGVSQSSSIRDQVMAAGQYLLDHGVKPGDGILPIYAAINAGHASKINASDAHNGGTPGSVLDKVKGQMKDHRSKAQKLIGGNLTVQASSRSEYSPGVDISSSNVELPAAPERQVRVPPVERQSLWELQQDAYNVEQTLPWLLRGDTSTLPDRSWSLTTDRMITDLTERGLDIEQYGSRIAQANSEASYLAELQTATENQERINRLGEAGLTGAALRVANAVLDPVALAADLGAATIAPQLVLANRASRTARTVAAAFSGAAGGAAAAGVSYAVNPNTDSTDLLVGTVLGMGVGGVVGALQRNPAAAREAAGMQRMAQQAVRDYESSTSLQSFGSTAGAAAVPEQRKFLDDEAFEFIVNGDIEESAFLGARGDLFAMLDKSNNPVTRALAGLVQDGTGKKNGAINAFAVSEERTMFRDEWATAFHRSYNPALKDYLADNKIDFMQRREGEARFNTEIDSFIRDRRLDRADRYHKSVVQVGKRIAQVQANILDMAKNPFLREQLEGRSVRGFKDVPKDDHYLTRYYDERKVILASREYTEGTIDDLVAGAIRAANPDMDEALLTRIAKGFSRNVVNRAHGMQDFHIRNLSEESVDELVEHLGLGTEDAANLRSIFESKAAEGTGRDARAKRRVLMDENYRLSAVKRRDGTLDEQGLGLNDLIVKDASFTFNKYVDQMSGMIALSRFRYKDPVTGELLVDGITSDAEFRQLLDLVRKGGAEQIKLGKMTKADVDADVKRLEFSYSHIRGRPVSDAENTDFGWWARMIRKFNFSRIMGQVGFAQLPEFGAMIGHLGLKATMSQMPALRRIRNMDGDTILKSGLADDLEAFLGVGTDRLRYSTNYRYDDLAGALEEGLPQGTWRDKADNALNAANRITSETSGMMQANIFLQRMTSAAVVQKFANMAAKGGKGISSKRLADLGLDQGMSDRVMKMLAEEGNLEFSNSVITGKKVRRLKLDAWQDKEAAEAFRRAVYRYTHQIVQRNDIGNLMMWMSHPAAKMLMQFRTFMVGAYAKQTLKSLHMLDGPALMTALWSMSLGGMVFAAQMQLQAIGRSDRDKFLEDRLAPEKLATAAFARYGASSIIPMLIDTGLYTAGGEGAFSHTRTTGQVSNMLFGNPTTGGFDDLSQAGRALSGLTESRDWSQEEGRAITRILPFGNSIPIVLGINSLMNTAEMPEYAPRD